MAKSLVAELHLLIHKMLKGLGRKSLSCELAIYCNYLKKKKKEKKRGKVIHSTQNRNTNHIGSNLQ